MLAVQLSHIDLSCPLFIPGNRADMLAKAGRYSPSAFVPDLEDSVPVSNKAEARKATAIALPELFGIGRPIVPRVNSLPTGLVEEDLRAVVGPHVVAISIGKISSSKDIEVVGEMISVLENEGGLQLGSIGILPWLETASAIVHAFEICDASDRVRWVAFGAEDYSADMGIGREVDVEDGSARSIEEYGEASLLYARSAVAVAARAAGVEALDTPYVKFRDADGLRREANLAKRLGYGGKFAIHPAQIETIEAVFSPSEQEIGRARRVLEAARIAELQGHGSVSLDGEMIDAPVVARAKNVLAKAGIVQDD